MTPSDFPFLGHGIGLRTGHYQQVLDGTRADWFEVISENFMIPGGRPLAILEQVRADTPIVLHGVSLSIGSSDPLNATYLAELAALASRIEPAWVSDHLCWGSVGGHYAHDLLPLPYTEEALAQVVGRVERVQERLDCGILLDVNNVYVSSVNHGFDPADYLAGVPVGRVGQIHLAGHSDHGTHLLDTHDAPVRDEVWDLLRAAVRRFGRVSTLVEWDAHLPPIDEVLAEAERARAVEAEILAEEPHVRAGAA